MKNTARGKPFGGWWLHQPRVHFPLRTLSKTRQVNPSAIEKHVSTLSTKYSAILVVSHYSACKPHQCVAIDLLAKPDQLRPVSKPSFTKE